MTPGTETAMRKLRLVLLATTTLTAMQFVAIASRAQSAPTVVAQTEKEKEEKEKAKQPPKAAPQQPPAAPKGAPPPPPAPPKAAPPPPPAPPKAAPPPPPPAPPRAAPPPPPPAPPREAPKELPKEAPKAGPKELPKELPKQPAPPPPAATPQTSTPPAGGPQTRPEERREERRGTPPAGATPPAGTPPTTPPAGRTQQTPPAAPTQAAPAAPTAPAAAPPPNAAAPSVTPGSPNAAVPAGRAQNAPPTVAPAFRRAPTVTAPLPVVAPPAAALTPIAPGAAPQGPRRIDDFRAQRREVQEGGRTVIMEPGRLIIRDPSGQEFVRHDEMDRFRFGARDIRREVVGGETRTVVIRPDGSQVITVVGPDGQLLRRIRRGPDGREIIIIDNSYRDPRAVGGFFVDLPPPVVRIPYDRYIVDYGDAPPEVVYDTLVAPPVDRIDRRYSLDEIRYSPNVRMLMPSIDVNTINFDLGSWEIPPDQAAKLQVIADGLNRAIQRNPREVFLIEGHTDATGNDTDNLSLSDRRAEAAAELLTQQFAVPAENLTSQGYGSQYLKEQTDGPSRINRRVTIRRITPLLNGNTASLPPPPPGIAPPR